MASRTVRAAPPRNSRERRIRQSWWWVAIAFGALAVLVIVRTFAATPRPIDVLQLGLVLLVGAAGVVHRRAIGELDTSRRQEAAMFARILQGLSRSASPDAIVDAIVRDLGAAAGADHTVVVRLRAESPILEATLVSARPGVPSSTTMLPLADLEDPGELAEGHEEEPTSVAIPIERWSGDWETTKHARSGWSTVAAVSNDGPLDAVSLGHAPGGDRVRTMTLAPASIGGPPAESASPGLPWASAFTATAWGDAAAGRPEHVASKREVVVPSAPGDSGNAWPESSRRVAERIADRVRSVYGFKNTVVEPLVTGHGVVGAIVLSRRTNEPWAPSALRVLAGATVEASAALERAYSHQEAEARASTDALTGLPNRRYFDEFCGLLARRRRADDAVGVLMIDIDHFKRLNDEFGHHIGDQVLKGVALAITHAVREGDVPARVGGEEFAVLLRNPGPGVARDVAERVRSAIAALDLSAFGPCCVTASIGYAVARQPEQSIPEIVEQADQALYRAKRTGRDRVVEG